MLCSVWMLFNGASIQPRISRKIFCTCLYTGEITCNCFSGIYDDDPEVTTLDRGDFGK